MEQKILVFFANQYSIHQDDGRTLEGVSVLFLNNADLTPINNYAKNGSLGCRFVKASLPYSFISKLDAVPGIYNGHFEPATDSKGVMSLKLKDIEFISNCNLAAKK